VSRCPIHRVREQARAHGECTPCGREPAREWAIGITREQESAYDFTRLIHQWMEIIFIPPYHFSILVRHTGN
jgi:hypothetical protein